MTRSVLFLCTGNSCRSQMAEAIVNHRLAGSWRAYSAGTRPAEQVHPKAILVLAEIGITHQGTPKYVDFFKGQSFDLVVTICDAAAEECPVWLGPGVRHHISFPDPATVEGTEAQILAVFRRIRDDIDQQMLQFLSAY